MDSTVTDGRRQLLQDLLIASLALWYLTSWLLCGCDPEGRRVILSIVASLCLYAGVRILYATFGDVAEKFILVVLCAACMAESMYGLSQVLGARPSGNAWFVITGHFHNPGPFGGYVACLMSAASAYLITDRGDNHILRALSWCAVLAGLLVLPASMSRSAWGGYAVGLVMALSWRHDIRAWLKQHRWAVPSMAAASVMLLPAIFMLKRESALGRLHIWMTDAMAILARPLFGCGPGRRMGLYGEVQQELFRSHPAMLDTWHLQAAGCPEYAFNDFLGIGMDCGLPGLLLGLAIAALCIRNLSRRRSPMAAGMVCWCIFALASYPLSEPRLSILPVVFLASSSGVPTVGTPAMTARRALAAMLGLAFLLPFSLQYAGRMDKHGKERFRELYDKGYALYQGGDYAASLEILDQGQRLSSDPMFLVIKGRCLEAMGDYAAAEGEYLSAHYRVPCRIYPMVRLSRLYIANGMDAEALAQARHAADMPVNQRLRSMQKLHDEAVTMRDSLAVIRQGYMMPPSRNR